VGFTAVSSRSPKKSEPRKKAGLLASGSSDPRAFPDRSDRSQTSRSQTVRRPSRGRASARFAVQWLPSVVVPGYSDGLAPDSHRLPADPRLRRWRSALRRTAAEGHLLPFCPDRVTRRVWYAPFPPDSIAGPVSTPSAYPCAGSGRWGRNPPPRRLPVRPARPQSVDSRGLHPAAACWRSNRSSRRGSASESAHPGGIEPGGIEPIRGPRAGRSGSVARPECAGPNLIGAFDAPEGDR
jgi:hypothetical protein